MLTVVDLDTKRSLDVALVQISLPSQTQTSRQIACANVISVTSLHKKNTHTHTLTTANFRGLPLIFCHYYHLKSGTKKRWRKLKTSAKLALLNKNDPHCQLDQSPSLSKAQRGLDCKDNEGGERQIMIQIDIEMKTQSDTEAMAFQHKQR